MSDTHDVTISGFDLDSLERELTSVRHDRDEWKAKYVQQNKDLGCEMMDPNGTIWEHAAKVQQQRDRLERELAEANYQIEKYAAEARQAIDAHGAAVVELAAAKQIMGELCESCGWAMRFPDQPCRCELERELTEAREKRDEALSDLEFRRELYALLAERCDRRTVELAETRNQRDRLANHVHALAHLLAAANEQFLHSAAVTQDIQDALAAVEGGKP